MPIEGVVAGLFVLELEELGTGLHAAIGEVFREGAAIGIESGVIVRCCPFAVPAHAAAHVVGLRAGQHEVIEILRGRHIVSAIFRGVHGVGEEELAQVVHALAWARARLSAGRRMAASTAMIATTTSSSMSVKPWRESVRTRRALVANRADTQHREERRERGDAQSTCSGQFHDVQRNFGAADQRGLCGCVVNRHFKIDGFQPLGIRDTKQRTAVLKDHLMSRIHGVRVGRDNGASSSRYGQFVAVEDQVAVGVAHGADEDIDGFAEFRVGRCVDGYGRHGIARGSQDKGPG